MSLNPQGLESDLELKFDYFRGVVADEPFAIVQALQEGLELPAQGPSPGPKQFRHSVGLWRTVEAREKEEAAAVVVSFGGNNDSLPGVLARGWHARDVLPFVQSNWGSRAKATRVDSCLDFFGHFDAIEARMQQMHRERRIARDRYGVPETGQTFYLGSDKSPVRCRLYQKGMKELPSMPPEERAAFWDWNRLELQFKPRAGQEQQKALLMTPLEVWGSSRWSRELLAWVAGLNPPRLERKPRMDRTAEERLAFVLRQYHRTLHEVGQERAEELLRQVFSGELGPVTREELRPQAAFLARH